MQSRQKAQAAYYTEISLTQKGFSMKAHETLRFKQFFDVVHTLASIAHDIKKAGGIVYLVGGCVRDLVMGRELKDLDVEVHKISLDDLERVLAHHGTVMLVGKKFGVLRIAGYDVDWALPRTDSKGRKPSVALDPAMTIEQACRRRDVTMNAMAINFNDLLDHHDDISHQLTQPDADIASIVGVIDPFGGLNDINHKRLRAVDEVLFLEDPLRFYRVMQFIGRFDMMPDERLTTICRTMKLYDDTAQAPLSCERIHEEMKKLLLKSRAPSKGFRWLLSLGRLQEIFPELYTLVGVPQPANFHPEGDVFEHTMQSLDAAAQLPYYADQEHMHADEEKFMVMLGSLCHDLGKPVTIDDHMHFYRHEDAGVSIAKRFLKRMTGSKVLIEAVCKLVRCHMQAFTFLDQGAKPAAYKRLAVRLAPEVTVRQLGLLALTDHQGTNPQGHEPLIEKDHDLYQKFLAKAEQATVAHGPEASVLLGRHLLDVISPGPEMGKLLKEAYRIQIEEGLKDLDELKRRVLKLRNDKLA
jgi:tRNA nucleotidyltransferase (CCA-adding enzyme)